MSKTLLSGLAALVLSALLGSILPALGITGVDLSVFNDGAITVADLLLVAGGVLVSIAQPSYENLFKRLSTRMPLSKALVSGLAAMLIASLLGVLLPALGLDVDLSLISDGVITWSDALTVVGLSLVSFAQSTIENIQGVRWIEKASLGQYAKTRRL